jgi:hypothetical protein
MSGDDDNGDAEEKNVSPWPILRQVSNDECWESLTKGDVEILGVSGREEWERRFGGNPCNDPRGRQDV